MTAAERLVDELRRLFATLTHAGEDDGLHLSSTQRLALGALGGGESPRLSELARRIRATDPTTSRAVDGLVALGLVERKADPADRRALRLVATAAGRKHVRERRRVVAAELEAALARLEPDEQEHLIGLLERLSAAAYSNSVSDARIT